MGDGDTRCEGRAIGEKTVGQHASTLGERSLSNIRSQWGERELGLDRDKEEGFQKFGGILDFGYKMGWKDYWIDDT